MACLYLLGGLFTLRVVDWKTRQCSSFGSDIWNEGNCGFGRFLKTCASWFMSSLVDSMSGSCLEFQFSLSHAIAPVRMVDIQH